MHYSTHLLRHTRTIIGKNIEKYRNQHQYSLAELAAHSGVEAAKIARYEEGKGDLFFPSLFRIACSLNVPLGELVTERT